MPKHHEEKPVEGPKEEEVAEDKANKYEQPHKHLYKVKKLNFLAGLVPTRLW